MKEYDQLLKHARYIKTMNGILSLLGWDQETYMPSGSVGIRSEQKEAMTGMIHREMTGKAYTNALAKLIDLKSGKPIVEGLTADQKAALREFYRDHVHATALPVDFVEEYARLTSEAAHVWQEARARNDFGLFLPSLEKIIEMSRKKAELLGYKENPYDALLDEYEPALTTREVSALFTQLRKSIIPLYKKICSSKHPNDVFLKGNFSEKSQQEFNQTLLKGIEYDLTKGRLDISTHPFSSSSHPTDNRITTRIQKSDLISNIRSVLHESGHAFYEMGLPVEHYGSPLGSSVSLGVHESQSRWWETRIGLSKGFWKHFLPMLKKQFKGKFDRVTVDAFYNAINKVSPSYIRVESDEVTYPLHVIIRFEIECLLIDGTLQAKDIPGVWNAKMKEYIGIVPKNDAEGCLQDIHWAFGAFGYFPTYTLGNIYCAQFFETFAEEFPNWEERIAKGEVGFMKDWLTQNIHRHGRKYTPKDLLKKVTGKKISVDPYINYLKEKYE